MVIKLYISGISGNKEVKKKQQRVQMILDSKQISYEAIDITEPGKEKDKEFMQQNGKVRESLGKYPLPPQIFNDDDFCGDYEDFDMANEVDELEKFLHIETKDSENGVKVNGMQEQIVINDESMEENKDIGETTKSEVNGENETTHSSPPSSEINLKTEASCENVPAPEKEEDLSPELKNAEDENDDKKSEKENNQQNFEEEEEEEVEVTKIEAEVENPKEEELKTEESPQAEEEEGDEGKSENEGGNESGRESPETKKAQDD